MGVLVLEKKRIVGSNRQQPCQKLTKSPAVDAISSNGPQPRNTRRPHTCSVRSARQRDLISAYFCLSPNSGARADIPGPPLWAKSGCNRYRPWLLRIGRLGPYSIQRLVPIYLSHCRQTSTHEINMTSQRI